MSSSGFLSLIAGGFVKGVNYGNKFVPEAWMTHRGKSVWGTKYGPAANLSNGAQRYQAGVFTEDDLGPRGAFYFILLRVLF